MTASQREDNSYSYNTVLVVLLTEVLKLVISAGLYCREHTFKSLIVNIIKGSNVLLLYFVPAFLYCLYNNLAFINLSTFDPTTYYLLLQLRVVITGILFQIIFKKYLSKRQWISLVLLTCGCMVKQIDLGDGPISSNDVPKASINKNMSGFDFSFSAIFILVQTVCSCLAGVYNEYLLKQKGSDINIYIQNVFMYLDSIICNVLLLLFKGELTSAFTINNMTEIFQFNVLVIMFNNSAIGIITSFFLKYLNSILKTFASALELIFTAILCFVLFAIPIYMNTVLSIFIVSYAIYLYSQSPVVNLGKNASRTSSNSDVESQKMLISKRKDEEDDEEFDLQMEKI